jgi:hypothetical protein
LRLRVSALPRYRPRYTEAFAGITAKMRH